MRQSVMAAIGSLAWMFQMAPSQRRVFEQGLSSTRAELVGGLSVSIITNERFTIFIFCNRVGFRVYAAFRSMINVM
jgi:hypothetical protein